MKVAMFRMPGKDIDPLESLKAEARKYKSAEEFVNRKQTYHGSQKIIYSMKWQGRIDQLSVDWCFGEYDTTSEGMFFAPDEK